MPKQFGTPGPRQLYPTSATSPSLAACSIGAQLLFDRLIAAADDQGRLQGDPIVVKAQTMPLVSDVGPRKMATWIAELAAKSMIICYEAGGQNLIQIRQWWAHQSPRWIYPSRWPAPPEWVDRAAKMPESSRNGSGEVPAGFRQSAGVLPARARVSEPYRTNTEPTSSGSSRPASPPSVSPTQRRANLSASVAVAEQILANPQASEPARAAATKAIDKANAGLASLGTAETDDVDFSAPGDDNGDATPEVPSGG